MDSSNYGHTLLYTIFKQEIESCRKKGARIFMFQFSSSDQFKQWVTSGEYNSKVVFSCYLLDSNMTARIEEGFPDAVQVLRTNSDSLMFIPYSAKNGSVSPLNLGVYQNDCKELLY